MWKFVLAVTVAVMFIVGVAYGQDVSRVRIDVEHERVTGTGDGWRDIVTYIKFGEEWQNSWDGLVFSGNFHFRVKSDFLDYLNFVSRDRTKREHWHSLRLVYRTETNGFVPTVEDVIENHYVDLRCISLHDEELMDMIRDAGSDTDYFDKCVPKGWRAEGLVYRGVLYADNVRGSDEFKDVFSMGGRYERFEHHHTLVGKERTLARVLNAEAVTVKFFVNASGTVKPMWPPFYLRISYRLYEKTNWKVVETKLREQERVLSRARQGDFDGDVDFADFMFFATQFGKTNLE